MTWLPCALSAPCPSNWWENRQLPEPVVIDLQSACNRDHTHCRQSCSAFYNTLTLRNLFICTKCDVDKLACPVNTARQAALGSEVSQYSGPSQRTGRLMRGVILTLIKVRSKFVPWGSQSRNTGEIKDTTSLFRVSYLPTCHHPGTYTLSFLLGWSRATVTWIMDTRLSWGHIN